MHSEVEVTFKGFCSMISLIILRKEKFIEIRTPSSMHILRNINDVKDA